MPAVCRHGDSGPLLSQGVREGGGGLGPVLVEDGGGIHQGQGSKGRRHGPPAGRKAGAPPLQGIQRLIF